MKIKASDLVLSLSIFFCHLLCGWTPRASVHSPGRLPFPIRNSFTICLSLLLASAFTKVQAQCTCREDTQTFSFQVPGQISLMCCMAKQTTLGFQTVSWCLKNNTNDVLEVSFTKNFTFTCGNQKTFRATIYGMKPGETRYGANFSGDPSLWNGFDEGDCKGKYKISSIKVSNVTIRNFSEEKRHEQAAKDAARLAIKQQQREEERRSEQTRQQADRQRQLQQKQQQIIDQLNETARRRGQAVDGLISSLSSLGSYVASQGAKKTIARMNEERRNAFDDLRDEVKAGEGEVVDCDYCFGEGVEDCEECSGEGSEECHLCDGGRQKCWTCAGSGVFLNLVCTSCGGRGSSKCTGCFGQGERICTHCGGLGKTNCRDCYGTGKLFIEKRDYSASKADYGRGNNVSHPAVSYPPADIPLIGANVAGLYLYADGNSNSLRDEFRLINTGSIHFTLNLQHPAPGQRTNFEFEYMWTDPKGRTKTHTQKSYIEPHWISSWHFHTIGPGKANVPGFWEPGTYQISVRYNGKVIAHKNFKVVVLDEDARHALIRGPIIDKMQFFCGDYNERVYRDTIATRIAASVRYEITWRNPSPEQKIIFPFLVVIYDPSGMPITDYYIEHRSYPNLPFDFQLPSGKISSVGNVLIPRHNWMAGKYDVRLFYQGRPVYTGSFTMVDHTDIPEINGYVSGIRFFESGTKAVPRGTEKFRSVFPRDSTRFVFYDLRLKCTARDQKVTLPIEVIYRDPHGAEFGRLNPQINVQADWISVSHRLGYGFEKPGSFPRGVYWVEFRYKNKLIGRKWFRVN